MWCYLLTACVLLSCVARSFQQDCSVEGDIRLVGGRHSMEGRLEVCLLSTTQQRTVWGTVCNRNWDPEDATVACRQLGVSEENLTDIVPSIYFQAVTGSSFHWLNMGCTGTETHLVNCTRTTFSSGDCVPTQEIGLICSQLQPECTRGDVRIVDASGSSSTEGRVEYCLGGVWGSVCGFRWDDNDAAVVCTQLGITEANVPRALSSDFTPSAAFSVPISFDIARCMGSEQRLGDCPSATHIEGCSHADDVGVNCTHVVECSMDGEVRLVNSGDPTEGRVEYCRDNLWGSVCRQSWDHHNAQVVCRQLGFVGVSIAEVFTFGSDDTHNSRIYPSRNALDCTGDETDLADCPTAGDCFLGHGAGVKCYNESNCDPLLGLRLVDGVLSPRMGTVELCYGDWGLICDDAWGDNDARVVCRQLGYDGGIALVPSPFATPTERFLLDEVGCAGSEGAVTDCSHTGLGAHNCHTSNNNGRAGVICGISRGAPLSRCSAEQLSESVPTSEDSLDVGGFGVCERYTAESTICDSVFTVEPEYVYITSAFNQTFLSYKLDQILSDQILDNNQECNELIKSMLCNYYMPPCGANGSVYVPRGVCAEECSYVEETCTAEWERINRILGLNENLRGIDCTANQSHLYPLPACCTDAGIEIVNTTTTPPSTMTPLPTTTFPPPTAESQVGLITAVVLSVLALLLVCIIVPLFVIVCVVAARKRKTALRRMQMEILSSPSVMYHDGPARTSNGSVRSPLAVPNPYASKQELSLESPTLLAPNSAGMMNRISSGIIRELTSTMLIPNDRLKLLDCVGHGEFGIVYKAHLTEPEGDMGYKTSVVAVKTLKGMFDQDQVTKIMEEGLKMKNFDHHNVLSLIGVCLDAGPAPYVVIPYMANGSLLRYLKKERRNLVLPVDADEDVRFEVSKRLVVICMQISNGMEYLAHEKFVHRDLAARNCMIDIHFVIKIADFGLSEDIYAKNYFRQGEAEKGTKLPVKWMAPESLSDGMFSEKSDVWSYGVTCWEVFSGGKTPYPGMDPMALSQMLEAEKRLSKPLNTACSSEMYQLMLKCWAKSPDKRPTFSDIVETISEYAEKIAGYLDISSYNPFTATYAEVDDDIVHSPEQVMQHMKNKENRHRRTPCNSPRGSPLPSPKGSPRNSPHQTPRGSPRPTPRWTPNRSPVHTPSVTPRRRSSVGAIVEIRINDRKLSSLSPAHHESFF